MGHHRSEGPPGLSASDCEGPWSAAPAPGSTPNGTATRSGAHVAGPSGAGLSVPIVNLWFPFQIMGDIWRAGLPAEQRRETAWLPALWWTCWLLSGLGIFGTGGMAVNWGSVPHMVADTNTASLCFPAVAGALLIAIIRAVSDGPVGSPLS
jgi:Domain of unknown function (DUF4328)